MSGFRRAIRLNPFKARSFVIFLSLYAVFFVFAHAYASQDEKVGLQREQSLRAVQSFQKALKSELMEAMGKGGPKAAITVCSEKAPEIAKSVANDADLKIGRTSLKARNPENVPDEWEKSVLEDFERRHEAGEKIADLDAVSSDEDTFRYMKAIPMQGMCMTCHGPEIDPELFKTIHSYYPEDKAISFRPGEIRGAFTVSIPLKNTK